MSMSDVHLAMAATLIPFLIALGIFTFHLMSFFEELDDVADDGPVDGRGGRAMMLVSGAICAVLLVVLGVMLVEEANIETADLDEPYVLETAGIVEDGVSIETRYRRYGSTKYYAVKSADSDGRVEITHCDLRGTEVWEDVATWDDARVDEVAVSATRYSGTFLGNPVSDIQYKRGWTTRYILHVPEGAVSGLKGE